MIGLGSDKNAIETYLCYITVNADNFMLIYLFERTTSTVPLHKLGYSNIEGSMAIDKMVFLPA